MRRFAGPFPFRLEVLGSILAVLIPSTLVMFYYYPSRQEELALDAYREQARQTAAVVAMATGEAIGVGDSIGMHRVADWVSNDPTLVYTFVTDGSGRVLIGFDPLHLKPALPDRVGVPEFQQVGQWMRAAAPARFHGRYVGAVHLGFSTEVQEEIANDRVTTMTFGLVVLLLGSLGSIYLAGRLAAPIAALRQATVEIAEGNYAAALPRGGSEELRALSSGFAAMSRKLQETTSGLAAARDSAQAAERAKADFLAMMSHELRTPLNGVTGMLGLLLDTELDRSQADYARTAHRSAESLLAIINDILDFSKIEAGKLELENIDFELRHTLEDVIALLAEPAHAKGLELATVIHEGVPARLRGDPGRLRQILFNLVGNAIKFTPKGEVAVRVLAESVEADTVMLRFQVTDTGIGIPEEVRRRLFRPFAQADASTTRRFGGTGLGLAICRRIAELMSGESGVDSEEGVGSTFWVTARFGRPDPASDPLPLPIASIKTLRVLVVDDSQAAGQGLAHQLGRWGVEVTTARDAAAALELLRTAVGEGRPYTVAIIDLHMPGVDGLDLGHAITGDPAIAGTRLVLLTSVGARGQAKAAQEAGFSAFLTKPLRQSALYDCLATLAGLPSEAPDRKEPVIPLITRHTLAEVREARRPRLLVAEDNEVNQRVAVGILERLGCRADVVASGEEAVEAVSRTHYDLVLMDCQMPGLDGYQASSEIRRREPPGRRVPIIALTADAMADVRERCLGAGMDDYLSKPVDRRRLEETLRRWLPGTSADDPPPDEREWSTHNGPIELERLRAVVGTDPASVRRYLELYVTTGATLLRQMALAVSAGEVDNVRRLAHTIKGASGTVGADEVAAIAARLEQATEAAEQTGLVQELEASFGEASLYARGI
jgi:signal transduction histidine kinase/DNA-binding response OmpR family regulator